MPHSLELTTIAFSNVSISNASPHAAPGLIPIFGFEDKQKGKSTQDSIFSPMETLKHSHPGHNGQNLHQSEQYLHQDARLIV